MLYLVRHAHAGSKAKWNGSDVARPLSRQGRKEALGLIERLRPRPIGRVLSSPSERCLQTVQPLAGQLGRPVEPSEALGVDGTGPGVFALLTDPALDRAVLCTHGEVIGKVFDELEQAGIDLSEPPQWPKGCTWILERIGGHEWRGTYLAPLAIEPAEPGQRPR